MEKIIRIEEADIGNKSEWSGKSGFNIITDEQTIFVGISNDQSCCENWGYLMSEDDLDDFKGAELKAIEIVDEALNKATMKDMYEGGAMFVNFETDKGTLQFVAYNEHNGYYSHEAVIVSKQLNHSEHL